MNNEIYLNNYKDKSIYNSNCVEFWAPITGRACPNVIEGRYWISTFGNTWNTRTNRPCGLSMHMKGYWQVALMSNDHVKQVTRKIHRIMMLTFCYFPGCEQYEVNHKDGIKTNNFLYNLEWATHSENTIHAINNGLKTVFGRDIEVILSDDDVKEILDMYQKNIPIVEIVDYMNKFRNNSNRHYISYNLVSNICAGKCRLSYHNNLYNHHE